MAKYTEAVMVLGIVLVTAPGHTLSIRNSKHDLSASSTTTGPKATSEAQLCIFCHTPHKPNPNVPLWNKVCSGNRGPDGRVKMKCMADRLA